MFVKCALHDNKGDVVENGREKSVVIPLFPREARRICGNVDRKREGEGKRGGGEVERGERASERESGKEERSSATNIILFLYGECSGMREKRRVHRIDASFCLNYRHGPSGSPLSLFTAPFPPVSSSFSRLFARTPSQQCQVYRLFTLVSSKTAAAELFYEEHPSQEYALGEV